MIEATTHKLTFDPMCSWPRCTSRAVWALRWNNAMLHSPEFRKTWLACDAHRENLTARLTVHGYMRESELLVGAAERVAPRVPTLA